jgi:hypothetical protein
MLAEYAYRVANVPANGTLYTVSISDWYNMAPLNQNNVVGIPRLGGPVWADPGLVIGGTSSFLARGTFDVCIVPREGNTVRANISAINLDWRWNDDMDAHSIPEYAWREQISAAWQRSKSLTGGISGVAGQVLAGLTESVFFDLVMDKVLNGDFLYSIDFNETNKTGFTAVLPELQAIQHPTNSIYIDWGDPEWWADSAGDPHYGHPFGTSGTDDQEIIDFWRDGG